MQIFLTIQIVFAVFSGICYNIIFKPLFLVCKTDKPFCPLFFALFLVFSLFHLPPREINIPRLVVQLSNVSSLFVLLFFSAMQIILYSTPFRTQIGNTRKPSRQPDPERNTPSRRPPGAGAGSVQPVDEFRQFFPVIEGGNVGQINIRIDAPINIIEGTVFKERHPVEPGNLDGRSPRGA